MDKRCSVVILLIFLTGVDTCLRVGKEKSDQGSSARRTTMRPKLATTTPSEPVTTMPSEPTDENKLWQCGVCGAPIDVMLQLENNLQEPYFNHSILLEGVNQRELFHLMVQASNLNKTFRFSMTHYGAKYGFMVDSINGLKSEWVNGKFNYWRIYFGNGTDFEVGVSTYVPQDKDEIVFRYVTQIKYDYNL